MHRLMHRFVRRATPQGFTLVEVLVALSLMAVLALLAWRSIDGMQHSSQRLRERNDDALVLQTTLAQWRTDLDAMSRSNGVQALDWDGRVLRITRRHSLSAESALQVVAWSLLPEPQDTSGRLRWQRWQSSALVDALAWTAAWKAAQSWGRGEGAAGSALDAVTPNFSQASSTLTAPSWQLYYYRDNSWTNPLSSAGSNASNLNPNASTSDVPDAIRLVLTLDDAETTGRQLTLDWVTPTLTRLRS